MCKFITDLFFTNVGLVLTVCLRAKQIIHLRNDTEKKMFELLCYFSRIPLCLLHLSTCLTGCVYDKKLGLYWLNRVEAPLLNQILCDSLICTASVDFIYLNCAFDIVICLFLNLDSMSAQFFYLRLQWFCIRIIKYFCRPKFSKPYTLQEVRFCLSFSCKLTLRFI